MGLSLGATALCADGMERPGSRRPMEYRWKQTLLLPIRILRAFSGERTVILTNGAKMTRVPRTIK